MKNLSDHKSAVILAQKQQIDELIEERDILKRTVKNQNKAIAELWDTYLSETNE